jgi:DUF4097 and DUF4098 domain-containing protein YvlB
MRITTLLLVAFTLASGPAAAQSKETETVDRTVAFSRGGTLRLKNFSGDVRVTGTSGNDVVIHAVRTGTRARLDSIKLDIQVDGSTINVEANRRVPGSSRENDNVVDTTFDIQVPSATTLNLQSFSSDLIVRDTNGDIEAQTFSGNIDLDVSGASAGPDLKAETFSGDITARVAPGSNGRLAFNTFSGDLRSDLPLSLHGRSRRNISADLGSGSGSKLDFKTFSGDLRLVK